MTKVWVGRTRISSGLVGIFAVAIALGGTDDTKAQSTAPALKSAPADSNIPDPYLAAWMNLTPNRKPAALVPGQDYGMDAATGKFVWPKATPEVHAGVRFPGELTVWDQKSYSKNVEVLAFYPGMGSPSHAWVNVADFDGHRYLYIHDRDYLRVLDTTDPRH